MCTHGDGLGATPETEQLICLIQAGAPACPTRDGLTAQGLTGDLPPVRLLRAPSSFEARCQFLTWKQMEIAYSDGSLWELFPGEARCLAQTWKRMKMEPSWGIREGGASETRSWRCGAPRPQVKLIQVRFPDG